jgi:hypothetical protein
LIFFQVKKIVKHYGLAVITREGSNPTKFVYEHDILNKYRVGRPLS